MVPPSRLRLSGRLHALQLSCGSSELSPGSCEHCAPCARCRGNSRIAHLRARLYVHSSPSSRAATGTFTEWSYTFWTDTRNRAFVKRHFRSYLRMYDALPHAVQRADVIRYMILYEYGGVYADLDLLKTLGRREIGREISRDCRGRSSLVSEP